jgi:hypothetical protein
MLSQFDNIGQGWLFLDSACLLVDVPILFQLFEPVEAAGLPPPPPPLVCSKDTFILQCCPLSRCLQVFATLLIARSCFLRSLNQTSACMLEDPLALLFHLQESCAQYSGMVSPFLNALFPGPTFAYGHLPPLLMRKQQVVVALLSVVNQKLVCLRFKTLSTTVRWTTRALATMTRF